MNVQEEFGRAEGNKGRAARDKQILMGTRGNIANIASIAPIQFWQLGWGQYLKCLQYW